MTGIAESRRDSDVWMPMLAETTSRLYCAVVRDVPGAVGFEVHDLSITVGDGKTEASAAEALSGQRNLETDGTEFGRSLAQIAADKRRTYDYLLRVSMIPSLRRAQELG